MYSLMVRSQNVILLQFSFKGNLTKTKMFDCSKGAANRRALKRLNIASSDDKDVLVKRFCPSPVVNGHVLTSVMVPSLQQKVFRLCAKANCNIFNVFIRCDSLGVARCQWEISKAKRLEAVRWLSPSVAKGFKRFEIHMPNPDDVISAMPAPQKRCPGFLKKKLQGLPWQQAFSKGQLALAPLILAHEEIKSYSIAFAAGDAGNKPTIPFVSIPFSEYTADMAHALRLGFTFLIIDGKLQIMEEEIIASKLQFSKIAKAFSCAGLQDFEALHALQFGAKSFSKAPKICSFAAPHASVFTNAVALRKKLSEEVDANWLLSAPFPCTIPSCSLRLKVVGKSGGGNTNDRRFFLSLVGDGGQCCLK